MKLMAVTVWERALVKCLHYHRVLYMVEWMNLSCASSQCAGEKERKKDEKRDKKGGRGPGGGFASGVCTAVIWRDGRVIIYLIRHS